MIEFKHVCKSFGEKRVLDDVSIQFRKGETSFVLGRSGVGKSVLLKHIVGLLDPDSGEIWVEGTQVTALSEEALTPVRKRCGMIFQYPALLDSLSVYENLVFGLRSHRIGENEKDRENIALENLGRVGLKRNLFERYPPELSFSVQKRVSIARALAISPDYLLFDEPTTGMDPVVTSGLNDLIEHLSQSLGVTCLVVSHDLESAFQIGRRIVLLDNGKIVFDGTGDEFRQSSLPLARDFVREGLSHAD